ncbi:uncharacterized protein [Amphiura filiformis]
MTSTSDGAEVTARLDLVEATTFENSDIHQAFFDGLSNDMFLGSDSQVVSASVSFPVINPCEEGTHDCYIRHFVSCVFEGDEEFSCEECETGYRSDTDADGEATCSEILPCEDDAGICTDKNFIDCVHDGLGEYHCENCQNKFSLEKEEGLCVEHKYVRGSFPIVSVQGFQAVYTQSLSDPNSEDFTILASLVCTEIILALNINTVVLYDCEIIEFLEGSIIAVYAITLDKKMTTATTSEIQTTLIVYMNSSSVLGVDSSSFEIIDICDGVTCMNDGWCVADDNFEGVCMCADGFEGDMCETTPQPQPPGGLSTPEIIGIAIGCSVFVILIVIILVFVILKVKAGAKVAAVEEDNEPEQLGVGGDGGGGQQGNERGDEEEGNEGGDGEE